VRSPLPGDVLIFARVLCRLPREAHHSVAARILAETEEAHRYFIENRKCHPTFGDGGLMSRCMILAPVSEPFADDTSFLIALRAAAEALLSHFEA
jgi:hypothetical protein